MFSFVVSQTANQTILIVISDANNNRPVFTAPKTYSATIPELMPIGSSVLDLTATDLDVGVNAVLTYSVVGTTGDAAYFYVDSLYPAGVGVIKMKQVRLKHSPTVEYCLNK